MKDQLVKYQLIGSVLWLGALGVIVYANYLSIKVSKKELAKE
jgi:hypothetical protein